MKIISLHPTFFEEITAINDTMSNTTKEVFIANDMDNTGELHIPIWLLYKLLTRTVTRKEAISPTIKVMYFLKTGS